MHVSAVSLTVCVDPAGACVPRFVLVCTSRAHSEMKQASDLVESVNQSHIKAHQTQPVDDQGSVPKSTGGGASALFLEACVCVCDISQTMIIFN